MPLSKNFFSSEESKTLSNLKNETLEKIKQNPKESNTFIINFKKDLEKLGLSKEKVDRELDKVYKDSPQLFNFNEKEEKNAYISQQEKADIIREASRELKENKDPEEVVNKAENKLKRLRVSKEEINELLQKIFDHFGFEKKQDENTHEELLKESRDYIQLPRLDIDYDDPGFKINLRKKEEGLLPSLDKPFNEYAKREDVFSKKESDVSESQEKERKEKLKNELEKKDSILVETNKLSEFIRQVKLVIITIPPILDKIKVEDILIRYFSAMKYEKFPNIVRFGWEDRDDEVKDGSYQNFDKLLEFNKKESGAIFIIRDIKTFNVYASQVLSGNSRNYFIIFIDGIVKKDDLIVSENLSSDMSYIWPTFGHFPCNYKNEIDKSFIEGEHLEFYNKSLVNLYIKQDLNKEIDDTEETKKRSREVLNVFLEGSIKSLSNPGLTLNESINRAPKFKNIMLSCLLNHDKRILVKLPEGEYGLDSFVYIWSKLKKVPVKPLVVRSKESYNGRKSNIQDLPLSGPVLIFTDHILTGDLIPKNLDSFYISGGGTYMDLYTILDISKAKNYPKLEFPREINIVNFITSLKGDVSESIDDMDHDKFHFELITMLENMEKLKSLSFHMSIEGQEIIVKKDTGID